MSVRDALAAWAARRFPGASIEPLAGDASTRRFYRVRPADGRDSAVVMDYGAPFEGETDDIRLARVFRAANLRVAELLEAAPDVGCLVLEDLGDRLLEAALAGTAGDAQPPEALVRAVDLAAAIAERGTPVLATSERAEGPALDEARFRFEMRYFLEHYLGGLLGAGPADPALAAALDDLADGAAQTPRRVLCHRDYHSRNIMLDADDEPAMVDIQDARWGPDGYDLASLLFDPYAEISPAWIEPLIERYLTGLDDPPSEGDFTNRLRQVAAQRLIKALGTYGYQISVRGNRRYEPAVPRALARLDELLPALTETHRVHRLLSDAGVLGGG